METSDNKGYETRERVAAGVLCGLFLFLGLVMADIATNGRISSRFGGSPADEAERYTKEAVR